MPSTTSISTGSASILAFVAVLACYTIPISGGDGLAMNPNELSRLLLVTAITEEGSLSVDQPAEVYGTSEDRAEREGKTYSDKAPGLSLLSAPFTAVLKAFLPREEGSAYPSYWPLRNILTWLLVALPASMLPFVMLRGDPAAGDHRGPAVALIFALATPLLTYGTLFFGHVPAAVLCALAWRLALRPGLPRIALPPGSAAICGLLAGFAVTMEYPTILICAVLFGTLLLRRAGAKVLSSFVGGAVAGLLPLLLYNQLAFGSPFAMGYAFEAHSYFQSIRGQALFGVSAPTVEGLWGALFSARRGIIYYCPLFLLVPIGLAGLARRSRGDAAPLIVASAAYIAFVAGLADWDGGWCAATRHLIPIVPLWIYPVAESFILAQRATWTRLLFAALAGISLSHAVLSVAFSPFFPGLFPVPLVQVTLLSLMQGAVMPSWLGGLVAMAPIVLATLWIGLAVAAMAVAISIGLAHAGRRRVLLATMAAAIVLDLGVEWALQPPRTPDQESMRADLLERLGYPDLANKGIDVRKP